MGSVALVLGGAKTLHADLELARGLIGSRSATIFATNNAGRDHDGPVHHWISYHVEHFPRWTRDRAAAGRPPAGQLWGPRNRIIPKNNVPVRRVENWGGSSGLLAVTAAMEEGHRRIILCGVPLNPEGAHYDDPRPWGDSGNYMAAWIRHRDEMAASVRSCSGWTAELLGRPTRAWLNGA